MASFCLSKRQTNFACYFRVFFPEICDGYEMRNVMVMNYTADNVRNVCGLFSWLHGKNVLGRVRRGTERIRNDGDQVFGCLFLEVIDVDYG